MKKLMIDLDGTMYHGTKIIEGADLFIKTLDELNIDYLFLTNNASRTAQQASEHMNRMGFQTRPDQFYTSAMAAAHEVKKISEKRRAFMIGEKGLQEALEEAGFVLVDQQADFVFVGLDRKADYEKYSRALRELKHGAVLVGTNDDLVLLSEKGVNVGNGAVVRMLELASGKKSLKIGKPSSVILEGALEKTGWRKEDVLIVGDNLETDILCGISANVSSALVLSGISTQEDVHTLAIHPDYIVHDLKELLEIADLL